MHKKTEKNKVLIEFLKFSGVGKSIAQDLWSLGLRSLKDLKNANPQKLYDDLCVLQGKHVDRCVLYVFRCSVYFASSTTHNPELLKWWN